MSRKVKQKKDTEDALACDKEEDYMHEEGNINEEDKEKIEYEDDVVTVVTKKEPIVVKKNVAVAKVTKKVSTANEKIENLPLDIYDIINKKTKDMYTKITNDHWIPKIKQIGQFIYIKNFNYLLKRWLYIVYKKSFNGRELTFHNTCDNIDCVNPSHHILYNSTKDITKWNINEWKYLKYQLDSHSKLNEKTKCIEWFGSMQPN